MTAPRAASEAKQTVPRDERSAAHACTTVARFGTPLGHLSFIMQTQRSKSSTKIEAPNCPLPYPLLWPPPSHALGRPPSVEDEAAPVPPSPELVSRCRNDAAARAESAEAAAATRVVYDLVEAPSGREKEWARLLSTADLGAKKEGSVHGLWARKLPRWCVPARALRP